MKLKLLLIFLAMNTLREIMILLEGKIFWNNNGKQWLLSLLVFLLSVLFFKFIFWLILRKLQKMAKKTVNDVDDFAVALIGSIKPPFYYIFSLYLASRFLVIESIWEKIIFAVFIIIAVLQVVFILLRIVDFVIDRETKKSEGQDLNTRKTILQFLGQIVKGVIWLLGFLMVLANLGVNVNSLIAGLGIGGLAVAMALKNILADIFSSFSILIDKPFVVGDYIGLNDKQQGTVKRIGIKTTRLQTRDGQELIVANKKLTDQVVQNFRSSSSGKKERSSSFVLGVVYETPWEKLKNIPEILREVIEQEEQATLKRVVFDSFGDFSLNFKVTMSIRETEELSVAEVKSNINYSIFQRFMKEGIEFAYPTQNIILKQNNEETDA